MREELTSSDFVRARGFSHRESDREKFWRWLEGPSASLEGSGIPRHGALLRIQGVSPLAGLRMEILWNGVVLATSRAEASGESLTWEGVLSEQEGPWRLELRFSEWNRPERPFAPHDPRPLALALSELRFRPRFETEGRLCAYPFSRMEMPGKPFVPCCQSWLREEYFRLDSGGDPWNGPAAQALRESIFDGSYRYCHLDRCGMSLATREEFRAHAARSNELPIHAANLEAAWKGAAVMPEGPAAATLMGDPRCNLACPSCRREKVTKLDPIAERNVSEMHQLLERHGKSLKVIKVAGDGEAFFSPDLKAVFRSAGAYPELERIDVLTNGILLDTLEELEPGAGKVRRISVSVDAGDGETYQAVRGGDWNRLMKNLEWAAAERKRGRFEFLGLNFVVRRANYQSLPAFFDLCERLGADEAYVSQLLPWERMPISLEEESVHLSEHPEHRQFLEIWAPLKEKKRSFRLRTNLP